MLTVSVCSKSCALAFSISSDTASSLDGARRYDSKRTIKTARDQPLKGRLNCGARPDDVTYSNNFDYSVFSRHCVDSCHASPSSYRCRWPVQVV